MKKSAYQLICLLLAVVLSLSLSLAVFAAPAVKKSNQKTAGPSQPASVFTKEQTYMHLNGCWTGSFQTPLSRLTYFMDPVEMNFLGDASKSSLFLTIKSYEANYTYPNEWTVGAGYLRFTLNQGYWMAEIDLTLAPDGRTLSGTYTQYGIKNPLTFTKIADEGKDLSAGPQFTFDGEPDSYWLEQIAKYPGFGSGGSIPFTYEMYAGDKIQPLLDSAPFKEAYYNSGTSDVEIMHALMNTLCDAYPHDGASGMPEKTDSISIMNYAREKGNIECRGLSIMLADVLRSFGIPAKVIMCIPATEPAEECHVLVHAYSYDLKQWVLLDPTYRLMLKNEAGNYMSLPMLRDALVAGTPVYASDGAGHNREPFSMEYYRAYMSKNTFRFSTPTAAKFDAESDRSNRVWMLAPKNYRVPYLYSRPETVTISAQAFWAAPK